MNTKRKVLVFIDWFYPAFRAGGPVKSVYNLCENLSDDFDFYIVCGNRDLNGQLLEVEFDQWNKGRYWVIYLSNEMQNGKSYLKLYNEIHADLVYYNSLFSINFTLKPLLFLRNTSATQLIAPRGMLGKGALSIKPIKKKLFLLLAKQLLFNGKIHWHATSKEERVEIKRLIGAKKVHLASNLAAALPSTPNRIEKQVNELKIFFLSRISKKKNLIFLLNLMTELKSYSRISLDIYGPIEEGNHWNECRELIESDSRISYMGELHPIEVPKMIDRHHLLVLPTLHENYGHAIAETLSQGRPVLLSDQTPWRGLEELNIGIDLPIDQREEWLKGILRYYEMDGHIFEQQINACFAYAKRNIVNSKLIEASRKLFAINE